MVAMGLHGFWLMLFMLAGLTAPTLATQPNSPDCLRRCGDVEIPYPFGLTKECSLHTNFLLQCQNSSGHPTPLTSNNLTIKTISVEHNEMIVLFDVTRDCYQKYGGPITTKDSAWLTTPSNIFTISSSKNMFTVIGCDSHAYLHGYRNNIQIYFKVLMTICRSFDDIISEECSGLGCCQTSMPRGLHNISVETRSFNKHRETMDFNNCSYGFVVEQSQFIFNSDYLHNYGQEKVPVVLDWIINNDACEKGQKEPFCSCGENSIHHVVEDGTGFYCKCKEGYQGNPYLPEGCQDIMNVKIQV